MKQYTTWFSRESLSADYGIYTYSRCRREFYHSPSDIHQGDELLYGCVCGDCVNEIFSKNIFM